MMSGRTLEQRTVYREHPGWMHITGPLAERWEQWTETCTLRIWEDVETYVVEARYPARTITICESGGLSDAIDLAHRAKTDLDVEFNWNPAHTGLRRPDGPLPAIPDWCPTQALWQTNGLPHHFVGHLWWHGLHSTVRRWALRLMDQPYYPYAWVVQDIDGMIAEGCTATREEGFELATAAFNAAVAAYRIGQPR